LLQKHAIENVKSNIINFKNAVVYSRVVIANIREFFSDNLIHNKNVLNKVITILKIIIHSLERILLNIN